MRYTLALFLLVAACGGDGPIVVALRLDVPAVLWPVESGVSNDPRPLIRWTPVDGARFYRVEVLRALTAGGLHERHVVEGATELRVQSPLPDGRAAYVRVDAFGLANRLLWSSGYVRFRVIVPPDWMPRMELVDHGADAPLSRRGYRLFDPIDLRPGLDDERIPVMALIDGHGQIVWWYRHPVVGALSDPRVLPNGNLMFMVRGTRNAETRIEWATAYEMTWDGAIQWQSREGVLVHHEVAPGPDGSYVYLRWIWKEVDGEVLEGDGIEVVDPKTNAVLWEWSIFDHFDPSQRPTPEMAETFSGHGGDWTHSNAVVWDADRSLFWLSVRHFDALLGIDYPSGDVRVILGKGGLGGEDLIHHQHAPEIQPDGSILLWDNGNGRPEPFSRALLLGFDEQAGAVSVDFEWRDDPPFFDPAVGDADRLPNGNILVTAGVSGRILEVDTLGRIVWEARFTPGQDWWIYRTEHLEPEQVPGHVRPFAD